ncbi:MAG: hypothetical protein AAF387_00500 [Pseudomonadota bacterium]
MSNRTALIFGLTLAVAGVPLPSGAETGAELGRIFLTPAERMQLDKQRVEYHEPTKPEEIKQTPVVIEPLIEEEPEVVDSIASTLEINGYVKRQGTSGTVWVNGASSYDGDLFTNGVDHLGTKIVGRQVRIAPVNGDKVIYVKPGQIYQPGDDATSDTYVRADRIIEAEPSP